MRKLRYGVAMSLDGFIASPDGGYDWIVQDPAIDFAAIFRQFDAAVMGRKTFDVLREQGSDGSLHGLSVTVFSRTLRAADHPAVDVVADGAVEHVRALKDAPGKDIWLFGGGMLFRSLLDAGLVDVVEVAVIPVILGGGAPLVAPGRRTAPMRLTEVRQYPSGIVGLAYDLTALS